MGGARIRKVSPLVSKQQLANNTLLARSPGVFGVDVSDPNIAASSWACMHKNGNYNFAIVECFRGGLVFLCLKKSVLMEGRKDIRSTLAQRILPLHGLAGFSTLMPTHSCVPE